VLLLALLLVLLLSKLCDTCHNSRSGRNR
jgi:hypothetical protein